jgi:hypothetical protein
MSQFDVAAVALPASAELESPCETRAKSAIFCSKCDGEQIVERFHGDLKRRLGYTTEYQEYL